MGWQRRQATVQGQDQHTQRSSRGNVLCILVIACTRSQSTVATVCTAWTRYRIHLENVLQNSGGGNWRIWRKEHHHCQPNSKLTKVDIVKCKHLI